MRRDLGRRLQAIEASQDKSRSGEVWIELADGRLCGPCGQTMARSEFDLACCRLPFVLILPDNGRDAQSA